MLRSQPIKGLSSEKIPTISKDALDAEDSAKGTKVEPWYLSTSIATLSNAHIDYLFLDGKRIHRGP